MANTLATIKNDRSDWSRYQIRVIWSDDYRSLGEVVGGADDKADAKKQANRIATEYYYGVAIVDIEDGTVDAGDSIILDLSDVKLV